jgi:hypothetical protein
MYPELGVHPSSSHAHKVLGGSCNSLSCLQIVSRVRAGAVLAIAVAEQQPAVWGYVVMVECPA